MSWSRRLEDAGINVYPHVATVTYLTDNGACVAAGPPALFKNQKIHTKKTGSNPYEKWVLESCHKLARFRTRFLRLENSKHPNLSGSLSP